MTRLLFLAAPLLWVALADIAPLLVMTRISLLDAYPVPPGQVMQWSLAAYGAFVATPIYRTALLRSLVVAAATTAGSLLLCYPLAYHIAVKLPAERRARRLMLLIAPFWTSEIIRIFGITLLLSNRGAVNLLLRSLGLTDAPVALLYGPGSVAFGMLSVALPSMLLPIYAVLVRLPRDQLDAAADLGAGPWQRFAAITLPASAGGVAAGCSLVFLLSLGAYAVPVLLGGAGTTVFADTIGGFFASAANRWPTGAAFSVILLLAGGLVSAALIRLVRPARGGA